MSQVRPRRPPIDVPETDHYHGTAFTGSRRLDFTSGDSSSRGFGADWTPSPHVDFDSSAGPGGAGLPPSSSRHVDLESLLRRDDLKAPASTSRHVIFESPPRGGPGFPSSAASRGVGPEFSGSFGRSASPGSKGGLEKRDGTEHDEDSRGPISEPTVTSAIVLEGRQLRKENEAMKRRLQNALNRLQRLKKENHRLLNAIEETEKMKRELTRRPRSPPGD